MTKSRILQKFFKNSCKTGKKSRKNNHQNHIPQTTGWSDQVRDFGKFWEVLGRGSGETLQTNHGIDPEAAHQ